MEFAIMGGTFNPVHLGHLICAERAYLEFNLDKVIFMPAGQPPHKDKQKIDSAEHRYNMLKLVVDDNDHFEISDWEIKRNEKSYTANTIDYFKELYNVNKVKLIIGTDSLAEIFSWYQNEYILKNSILIVAKRNSYSFSEIMKDQRLRKYEKNIKLLDNSMIEISSTEIRKYFKEGKSIKYLTIDPVINYIKTNNLYG
ncbi:MAG: nicotinate (nicotinamide) nucleotide adenylyltransferase [Halanaerobiales bacterium]|nr:nicotinate (nicotinamide) nucleotide adenylyltransferase [Halanaerobiales bacterium]